MAVQGVVVALTCCPVLTVGYPVFWCSSGAGLEGPARPTVWCWLSRWTQCCAVQRVRSGRSPGASMAAAAQLAYTALSVPSCLLSLGDVTMPGPG
jgi:hypothetical protein